MFHLDPEDPDSAVNKLKPNELIKCLLVFYIIKPKKHGARALQSILKRYFIEKLFEIQKELVTRSLLNQFLVKNQKVWR